MKTLKNLVAKYKKTYEIAVINNELDQHNEKMDYYTSNTEVFAREKLWMICNQINFDSSFNKNINEYNQRLNVFDKLDESTKENSLKKFMKIFFKIEQKLKRTRKANKNKKRYWYIRQTRFWF